MIFLKTSYRCRFSIGFKVHNQHKYKGADFITLNVIQL